MVNSTTTLCKSTNLADREESMDVFHSHFNVVYNTHTSNYH